MACENHANTSSSLRSVVPTWNRHRVNQWVVAEPLTPCQPSATLPEEQGPTEATQEMTYAWRGLETVEFFYGEISLANELSKETRT